MLVVFVKFYSDIQENLNLSSENPFCIKVCQISSAFVMVTITIGVSVLTDTTKGAYNPRDPAFHLTLILVLTRILFESLLFIATSVTFVNRNSVVYSAAFIASIHIFAAVHGIIAIACHWVPHVGWVNVTLELDFEDLRCPTALYQFLFFFLIYDLVPISLFLYLFKIPLLTSEAREKLRQGIPNLGKDLRNFFLHRGHFDRRTEYQYQTQVNEDTVDQFENDSNEVSVYGSYRNNSFFWDPDRPDSNRSNQISSNSYNHPPGMGEKSVFLQPKCKEVMRFFTDPDSIPETAFGGIEPEPAFSDMEGVSVNVMRKFSSTTRLKLIRAVTKARDEESQSKD
ncbi:hypothetical protein Ciccas_007054 [Cichlidogyrus casuarinus]|uniref:Uncharacterized protein n=1 Tax=Cichlidogyrus casuarinus TaxID=1844966 RepID=A0ABD2Q3Y8_9PLAT